MKVYLVCMYWDYEGEQPLGVFATLSGARASGFEWEESLSMGKNEILRGKAGVSAETLVIHEFEVQP